MINTLLYRANYLWRLFGTGFSFLCFGLGGLVLPILVLPIMLFQRDQNRREKIIKNLIHCSFKFFIEMMRVLGVLSYDITNKNKLTQPGQLIIANHPTLLDVVFLISIIPHADCVVKSTLLRNPFTRGPLRAGRYIGNDNPEQVINEARQSLARGNSLIIFPEGTRTKPQQTIKFQRGAANIAIRASNKLSPVIINCTPPTLSKQDKWYQIPVRKFHMSLEARDDISITPFLDEKPSISSRQLTKYLQEYFTKEMQTNGQS